MADIGPSDREAEDGSHSLAVAETNNALDDRKHHRDERVMLLSQQQADVIMLQAFAKFGTNAEKRLATYHERRGRIFGTRSLLPLCQTGNGALSRTDVEALHRQDQWIVLPNDKKGRPVYFVDSSSTFRATPDERLRCLFYLASLAVQLGGLDNGVALVIALPGDCDDEDGAQMELSDDVSQNLEEFFGFLFLLPVQLEQVHFVAISEAVDETWDHLERFQANLGPQVRPMSKIHAAKSSVDLLAMLEHEGFETKSLPPVVGGTFDMQAALHWHRTRAEVESTELSLSGGAVLDDSETSHVTTAPPVATVGKDQDHDFVRKRNAMYARRKYARRKIEIEVLRSQCQELQMQRQSLTTENIRLEGLLREANRYVSISDASGGCDARLFEAPPTQHLESATEQAANTPKQSQALPERPKGEPVGMNWQLPEVHAQNNPGHDILRIIEQALQDQLLSNARDNAIASSQRVSSPTASALSLASALLQQSPNHSHAQLLLAALQHDLGNASYGAPPPSNSLSILHLLSQQQNLLAAARTLSPPSRGNQSSTIAELLLQEGMQHPPSPNRQRQQM